MVARVVTGSDAVGSDLTRRQEELVELQMVVTEGAGNRGSSVQVLVDEGTDDVRLEALLLIDDVVRDAELLGYGAGVVDVVEGAAAPLDGFGHSFVTGETTLIPELQGEADESVSLGAQDGRDGGGVNSSGHGDCDRVVQLLGHCSIFSLPHSRGWGVPPVLIAQSLPSK